MGTQKNLAKKINLHYSTVQVLFLDSNLENFTESDRERERAI